jgi:hypothetical protein
MLRRVSLAPLVGGGDVARISASQGSDGGDLFAARDVASAFSLVGRGDLAADDASAGESDGPVVELPARPVPQQPLAPQRHKAKIRVMTVGEGQRQRLVRIIRKPMFLGLGLWRVGLRRRRPGSALIVRRAVDQRRELLAAMPLGEPIANVAALPDVRPMQGEVEAADALGDAER